MQISLYQQKMIIRDKMHQKSFVRYYLYPLLFAKFCAKMSW